MKIMLSFVILLFVISSIIHADNLDLSWEWTKEDILLQSVYITLSLADYLQTRTEAESGWKKFREANGFMEEHPTVAELDAFFFPVLLSSIALSNIIPHPLRNTFLVTIINGRASIVINNHNIGARINLKF